MGITKISVLAAHPPSPFNLVKEVMVDVMHCVYLGMMAKAFINSLWCETTHRFKPFSIRRKVREYTSKEYELTCLFSVEGM